MSFGRYTIADFYWGMHSIQEARYAIAAAYGLQIYEWISGIEEEIRLIIRAKWTSVKVAYLFCRYYPMLLWPLVMWSYLSDHPFSLCKRAGTPVHILLAPCQFFPQAVMLMRAYAFSGRNHFVLVILAVAYIALLGIDLWAFGSKPDMPPEILYILLRGTGCFPNYGEDTMATRFGISMLGAILMDLVSLVVVLIYCKKESDSRGGTLGRYFIKQGLSAFVMVTVVYTAAAIAFFKPPRYHSGLGLPFVLVVPNLVACRVILQLRRKVYPTQTEISRQHSRLVNAALETKQHDMWLMDSSHEVLTYCFPPR